MNQNTTDTQFFHVTITSKFPNVQYKDPIRNLTIGVYDPLHIVIIGVDLDKIIDVIETKFNFSIHNDYDTLMARVEPLQDGSECEAKYIIVSKQDGNYEMFTITESKEVQ